MLENNKFESDVWKLIGEFSKKSEVTEIVINSTNKIFVEERGLFTQLQKKLDLHSIEKFIQEVAHFNNKKCNESHPLLDGNLPDGSRINIVHMPIAANCPAITIRKYLKSIQKFKDSPGIFGLNEKWVMFIIALVKARKNIVISGGTGVGKTTFMNLLLQEISPFERVVTIEDTLELNFDLPNVVRLEAKEIDQISSKALSIRDLVKNALRMKPDRIIVGETRGGELFDLLVAMNTGHPGSMTSLHANSASETLNRFEMLYMLAGYDVPLLAIRKQVATAVDFVIHLGRNKEGKKVVNEILEVTQMIGDKIAVQQIAELVDKNRLMPTKVTTTVLSELEPFGIKNNFFQDF